VAANTDQPWVLLYVKRWLVAPVQQPDGTLAQRDHGTPQGSAVSPVAANLFLHYAFDAWMVRQFPAVRFERYVDDAVVHCTSEQDAHLMLAAINERMAEVGLTLHPTKTKIVYCRDSRRRGTTTPSPSRSWGTRSGPARPAAGRDSCLPGSCPR
jgi:RNA-directed DNA polymerase